MDSQQQWVPAHLCQKPRGAALMQEDSLQKLVLVLQGLLDFKIIITALLDTVPASLFSLKPKQQSKNQTYPVSVQD